MKVFGWEHIVYLVVCTVIAVPALICAKKFSKSERSQKIIIKVTGGVLLASILASRITQMFIWGGFVWHYFLPTSFCGTTSLVLAFAVLFGKKDNCVYHFIWFLALLGGIITSVYPDFLEVHTSFFHPDVITSFLHHTLSIVMVVVLLMFKQINFTYKKLHYSIFGFCCYLTYGAFLISVLKYTDALCIMTPILSGTPFTAWVMAPIYFALYGLIILTIELVRRHKRKHAKPKVEN